MRRAMPMFLFVVLTTACAATPQTASPRPPRWAQPLEHEGLPNFHRLSPQLYRGAQPNDIGFKTLEQLGVRTVINLRSWHSDRSKLHETDLDYVRIRMDAWDAEIDEVARFLRVATDKKRQPVFVHCKHGADRTGMACAIYRVIVGGWTREDAIREMTEGGYGFHSNFDNLIEFVRTVDLDDIAARAGWRDAIDG